MTTVTSQVLVQFFAPNTRVDLSLRDGRTVVEYD